MLGSTSPPKRGDNFVECFGIQRLLTFEVFFAGSESAELFWVIIWKLCVSYRFVARIGGSDRIIAGLLVHNGCFGSLTSCLEIR